MIQVSVEDATGNFSISVEGQEVQNPRSFYDGLVVSIRDSYHCGLGDPEVYLAKTLAQVFSGGTIGMREAQSEKVAAPDPVVTKAGTGVMVAFMLPPDVAQQLALEGGEQPEELHITIAYFGKDLPAWHTATIARVTGLLATQQPPLKGEISGVGVFPASESTEGRQVLVRLVDVPYLESFRERLLQNLQQLGITPLRNHGYTPHITLQYAEKVELTEAEMVSYPITVDRITLAVAGEYSTFELGKRVSNAPRFGWEDF